MGLLKRMIMFIALIFILGVIAYFLPFFNGNTVSEGKSPDESVVVTKIIDGDTIVLSNSDHVRLLGVNTPEKGKPYSEEAKLFLESEILGKTVSLESDNSNLDRYGRKLRYVIYDGRILNVEILERGFATSFMLSGLRYQDKLITAENFAINSKNGLWKKSLDPCSSCMVLVKLNPNEDYFIIQNNCTYGCNLSGWLVKDDANHFFKLSYMSPGESKKYTSKGIWNDDSDRFFMRDSFGDLVIFYSYP